MIASKNRGNANTNKKPVNASDTKSTGESFPLDFQKIMM